MIKKIAFLLIILVFSIQAASAAPTVVPGGPYSGYKNENIDLNGYATNPGNTITRISWDPLPSGCSIVNEFVSVSGDQNRNDAVITCTDTVTGDVQLTADNNNSESTSETATLTISNRAPTATLDVTPTTGTFPLQVTITGACADSDGNTEIVACRINLGDGNTGIDMNTMNGSTHTYYSASTFTITLTATDTEAETGTDTESVTTSAPAAPSILNKLPSTDMNTLRPTISFDVNDNGSGVNISSLAFFVDGNAITPTTTAFGSDYFATWTFTYDIGDGKTIYIGASASDNSGNSTGDVNWSFSGDRTAPTISSISVAGYTNDSTPTITLETVSGNPSHMSLSCDGTNWKAWQTYSATVTDFSIISASYGCLNGQQGTESIYLRLKDAAGNISASETDSTVYDTQAPDTPTLNSATAASEEVDLSWDSVSDNGSSGLDEYVVYQDGSQVAVTTSTSYTVQNLANGTTYSFKIKAKDNAGNLSGFSNTIDATPSSNPGAEDDTSAPFISWEMPSSGSTVSGTVLLKVHAYDDESGIRFISFRVDNIGIGTDNTGINERFTYDWNSETVQDGTHTLKAIAKSWGSDEENNSTAIEITITTNNGITSGNTEPEEGKEEAEAAITEAENAKETATALVAETDAIGFEIEETTRKKYDDAIALLDEAKNKLEDENYSSAKMKAEGAKAKFEDFTGEMSIGQHGEEEEYTFNEEHLGMMLDELGLGEESKEEVQTLLEEFTVDRTLSIKKIENTNGTQYKATITLAITNDSNSEKTVHVVEIVPKDFALDANMLSGQGFTIISADPVISWDVNLAAGETTELVYSLKEGMTEEQADEMLSSETINKFSVPPILFKEETSLNEEMFSGPTPIGLLGLGGIVEIIIILAVLAVIGTAAIFTMQTMKNKESRPTHGLNAVTKQESFLDKLTAGLKSMGSRKEEPKKPRWGYRG